jgi:hypothetical protein
MENKKKKKKVEKRAAQEPGFGPITTYHARQPTGLLALTLGPRPSVSHPRPPCSSVPFTRARRHLGPRVSHPRPVTISGTSAQLLRASPTSRKWRGQGGYLGARGRPWTEL